jgi:hypothetical protein
VFFPAADETGVVAAENSSINGGDSVVFTFENPMWDEGIFSNIRPFSYSGDNSDDEHEDESLYHDAPEGLAVSFTGRVCLVKKEKLRVKVKVLVEKSDWRPVSGRYRVHFEPSDFVFRTQADAIRAVSEGRIAAPIRKVILGEIPEPLFDEYPVPDASYRFGNKKFTATRTQTEAVNRALTRPFTIVQGPPGCGKTAFIAAFIVHYFRQPVTQKVLVCACSNVAVENLVRVLLPPAKAMGLEFVWLATASHDVIPSDTNRPEHKALCYQKMLETSDHFKNFEQKYWRDGVIKTH